MTDSDQPDNSDPEQALSNAIHDKNDVLAAANTVLKLSPEKIILNRTRLVIEKKNGFGKASVLSTPIEDVISATVTIGPIFGSIQVTTKQSTTATSIGLFRRADALRVKRTIQGYVIALQKHIDITTVPTDHLRKLLYELGEDDHSVQ